MIERSNFKAKRKIPFVAQAVGSVGLAFAAISPTCAGSEDNNTKPIGESDNQPNLGYAYKFPWADDETWYLTGGPHADGLSNGVLYAEDFAPSEVVNCTTGHEVITNRFVRAAAGGTVIISGNEKDPTDKSHSIVALEHDGGVETGYMHLANIKVTVGQKVNQGDILGNPSCEFPPGGRNTGAHLHFFLAENQTPEDITRLVVSGWNSHSAPGDRNGTMTKSGEDTRTADVRRCGPSKESIKDCGGIRNDLENSQNLLASTMAPVATISKVPTVGPVAINTLEAKDPTNPENSSRGIVHLQNWELDVTGWREVIAIEPTGGQPKVKEGWKRVVIDANAKNVSSTVQNVQRTLVDPAWHDVFEFEVKADGFEYKANLGAPMNSIEWGSTATIEIENSAPGTTVPVQLVAEVPQNKTEYDLVTTINQSGIPVQTEVMHKGETSGFQNTETGEGIKKPGEAWVIPNFAKITFNRVRTEEAETIANGNFQEQFAEFSLENDYGRDIQTRYGTELELIVYLKDGRVVHGSQYYYSNNVENVQSVAPGITKNFVIEFGSNADVGASTTPLYDVSGAKFVLIFKDGESTKFVGSVFASWQLP